MYNTDWSNIYIYIYIYSFLKGNWSSINFNKMLNILIWQDSKKVLVVVFFFFSRLCVPTRIRHGVNEFLRNSSTHFDSIQSITVLDHATSSSTYHLFFFFFFFASQQKKKVLVGFRVCLDRTYFPETENLLLKSL